MNKTKNYQLSQWEKSDRLMMDDFNADNGKIDAALAAHDNALAAKADKTTTNSLQTQVNAKTAVVTGSYTGTYNGNNSPTQTIYLGFTPKAVIFFARGGPTDIASIYLSYGLVFPGHPMYSAPMGAASPAVAIQNDTLVVASVANSYSANNQGQVYHYIAFR